jgi:D-serine dehydratase
MEMAMGQGKDVRAAAFRRLAALELDATVKGFPPLAGPIALGAVGQQGWNLLTGDLAFPVAVLRQSSLAHNSRWMRAFIESNGIVLAPHGKTTMAPQLFDIQERDGAWGMTVATVQQLAVCRRFGFERVLLANEPVGGAEIDYLFAELDRSPALELYCLIDSADGVERIAAGGQRAGNLARLQLLVEVGVPGGRTGCRTLEQAVELACAARRRGLTLRGVEGFEGILKRPEEVDAFLDLMCGVAKACAGEGLFSANAPTILSAGGSAYYDRVAARLAGCNIGREVTVVVRSGCYLTHDSLIYDEAYRAIRARAAKAELPSDDPIPALMVWTHVQSRPEPDRAILAMGRRDVSYDAGLPVPLLWFRSGLHESPAPVPSGHTVTALNDQHCYLACPDGSPVATGDLIGFGISHPCTTFDKWSVVFVVDDRFDVVDAVKTFF